MSEWLAQGPYTVTALNGFEPVLSALQSEDSNQSAVIVIFNYNYVLIEFLIGNEDTVVGAREIQDCKYQPQTVWTENALF